MRPLLAARVVGLDIAGIDLVTTDITRPLEEQRGAIIEVNASPGLLAHIKPGVGQPRPVGAAIVDHLFAPEETGRIPLIGVTGTRGASLIVRMLCKLLQPVGPAHGRRLQRRHVPGPAPRRQQRLRELGRGPAPAAQPHRADGRVREQSRA